MRLAGFDDLLIIALAEPVNSIATGNAEKDRLDLIFRIEMKTIAFQMKLVITSVAALLCGNAAATLVNADYTSGSGDRLITIDSSTGLKWLNVALTANLTFDQVRTGVWYSRGFRYATKDELKTLFSNAGTPDDGFDVTITHPAETLALARLLGPTLDFPGRVGVSGFIGTDYFGQEITLSNHPVGEVFSAQLGKIDYLTEYGEAHFTGGHPFSDEASPYYGSFLVSTVPEPSSGVLLAAGLLAVVFWCKRKVAVFTG